jgi:hypothetical protein
MSGFCTYRRFETYNSFEDRDVPHILTFGGMSKLILCFKFSF